MVELLGKTEFRIKWTPVLVEYWPATHFVAGHSWSVCLKYQNNALTGYMPYLSVYIYCNKDMTMQRNWSCTARTQFSVIPRTKTERRITRSNLKAFKETDNLLAIDMFCDWNTVIQSCKKGKLIFETKVDVFNEESLIPNHLAISLSPSSVSHSTSEEDILADPHNGYTNAMGQFRFPSTSSDKENDANLAPNGSIKSMVDELRNRIKILEEERKNCMHDMEMRKEMQTGVITELKEKILLLEEKNLTLVVDNQDLKSRISTIEGVVKTKDKQIASLKSQVDSLNYTVNVFKSQNPNKEDSISVQLVVTPPNKRQSVAERLFNI